MAEFVMALGIFGWIPIAVYFKHKIYLEQLQNERGASNAAVAQAIEQLRAEMAALRETTTKFDMSFDAALTQMEERLERLERKRTTATTEESTQRLGGGGL